METRSSQGEEFPIHKAKHDFMPSDPHPKRRFGRRQGTLPTDYPDKAGIKSGVHVCSDTSS